MNDSFTLGLLHGVLYGITPVTPWFIALKRYVYEGPTKGLLTFVGLCFGQFGLVVLAFCGNREVLVLWYFVEPVLVLCGVCVLWIAFISCWETTDRPTPIATRKEALKYVASGVLFALCNPGGLMFSNLLLTALPGCTWLYLSGFFLMYASLMAGAVYLAFFSPRAPFQKWFGPRVLLRNPSGYQLAFNFAYRSPRVSKLRVMSMVTAAILLWQVANYNDAGFWTNYTDMVYSPPWMQEKEDFSDQTHTKQEITREDDTEEEIKARAREKVEARERREARKKLERSRKQLKARAEEMATLTGVEEAVAAVPTLGFEEMEATGTPRLYNHSLAMVENTQGRRQVYTMPEEIEDAIEDTPRSIHDSGTASILILAEDCLPEPDAEEDGELDIESIAPWDTVLQYDAWNDRLDREPPEEFEKAELKMFYNYGFNALQKKYLVASLHLRKAPLWETHKSPTRILVDIRDKFDAKLQDKHGVTAISSKNRTFLPFNMYEIDYDFYDFDENGEPLSRQGYIPHVPVGGEDGGRDLVGGEDDVPRKDERKTQKRRRPFQFLQTQQRDKRMASDPKIMTDDDDGDLYPLTQDMYSRGNTFEDFGAAQTRDLPQEIHFPWDYPALEPPNTVEVDSHSPKDEVITRTKMQDKNVRFLDPIALNTRFLANNPFALKDDGRTRPICDTPKIMASNTTFRWWVGRYFERPSDRVRPAVVGDFRTNVLLRKPQARS
jgi:threonine/homoserine/homoserine lactone efflux protein